MTTAPGDKFRCTYTLDDRLDRELIVLSQELYRFIPIALGPNYSVPIDEHGVPKAVPFYLLYLSALVHGVADAAVTLILHNLGREARLLERQLFEYLVRASYYSQNAEIARLAMYARTYDERKILDGLGYSQDSERYERIVQECAKVDLLEPDAKRFKEPPLRSMLKANGDAGLDHLYTFHYRIASQMAHGTFAGIAGVVDETGVAFDSRVSIPNHSVKMMIIYLLGFLGVIDIELNLSVGEALTEFKRRFDEASEVAP